MGTLIPYQANDSEVATRTAEATESLLALSQGNVITHQSTAYANDGKLYRYVAEITRAGVQSERWVEVGNPANVLTARPAGWMGKAANMAAGATIGTIRYRAIADVGATVAVNDTIHATWVLNGANEPTPIYVNATKNTTLTDLPPSAALIEATIPSSVLSLGQTWTDGQATPSLYVLRDDGTARSFVRIKGTGPAVLADASTLSLVTGSTTVNTTFPAETAVTYRANTASVGYAVGDIILRVLWVNRDTPGAINGSFWFNATSGQILAAAPAIANLTVVAGSSSGGGGASTGEVTISFGGLALSPTNRLPVNTGNVQTANADVSATNPLQTTLTASTSVGIRYGTQAVDTAHPLPIAHVVSAPSQEISTMITTAATGGGFLYTLAADANRLRGYLVNNSPRVVFVRESMTPANVAADQVGSALSPGATYYIDTPGTVTVWSSENTARLYGLIWSAA